jgi:hypothetical protein
MRLLPWGETNFCISHEEKKLIHVSYQLPAGKNALIKGVWIGLSRKKPACLSFTSPCEFFSYFVFVGLLERDEEDGFQGNGGLEREQDFFQCILGDRRQAGWFNFKFFFFFLSHVAGFWPWISVKAINRLLSRSGSRYPRLCKKIV